MLNLAEGEYFGEFLKTSENNVFKLSMTRHKQHSELKEHAHENNYLSILTNGSYIEKSKSNKKLIISGEILYRPSSYVHQNMFENSGGSCFNIGFKSGWEEYLNSDFKMPDSFVQYPIASFPSLYKLIINFKTNYNEDLALEFIYEWLCAVNQQNPIKAHQPWIGKVEKILKNELDVYHSLSSIAERVCVHPVYLARVFKEKKGLTIGEYQLKMKLANALSLLLNTTLPISQVSLINGFFDDAHFIRSFKSIYGISPHKFRLRLKS